MPTPGGPNNSTLSPLPTQRDVASSRICFGSTEGCASYSKLSSVRTYGNFAIDMPIWMRRSSLRATSAVHSIASASRRFSSARPAWSSSVSS